MWNYPLVNPARLHFNHTVEKWRLREQSLWWQAFTQLGAYQKSSHSRELKCSKSWRDLCVLAWATALWEGLLLCCDLQRCFYCRQGRSLTWCTVLLFCPQLQQGVSCSVWTGPDIWLACLVFHNNCALLVVRLCCKYVIFPGFFFFFLMMIFVSHPCKS